MGWGLSQEAKVWKPLRKRKYVLTITALPGETIADTDRRVWELLGATKTSTDIVVSAYQPSDETFYRLMLD